jgi:hypothetical protein
LTLFYFSDVTAVSGEVMVESQKDHISVPITHSTERLNEEKGDSSRSGSLLDMDYYHLRSNVHCFQHLGFQTGH